MPLDKKKVRTKCKELPICGICKKRFTVAEILGLQFDAIQENGGHLAYYHATCMRMEAGGHD